MASNSPITDQEIIRTALSFVAPFAAWFAGKFIYNRWEKRKMDAENLIKENEADKEASNAIKSLSEANQTTARVNIDLNKELSDMRKLMQDQGTRLLELERKVKHLADENIALRTKNNYLSERVQYLSNGVNLLLAQMNRAGIKPEWTNGETYYDRE